MEDGAARSSDTSAAVDGVLHALLSHVAEAGAVAMAGDAFAPGAQGMPAVAGRSDAMDTAGRALDGEIDSVLSSLLSAVASSAVA